ncbi:type II toxin-antitoxin system HicB family antitoxin [Rhodoferax sp. 4810]|uniref:Type II toxin-antitoxin system HicB family antitoxin n=1 Tax=Thiospirillum jenense TaxID=1653858 RepID=A0A839HDC0_9GAMM|nr:type II toxin-antitoxin system HicB family antitoxin [Thiospirillum jenense]MBB1074173.1 type II toxin-antitoxin system HicB family antitoxin [Rhodoferax jenense]MBB1125248.1 type II toxin-antitoxin system HicB family antitoxin [Thiospirillum jenense]
MNSHYSVLIQWSDEDDCYIAALPEFGPYALTHGDSYEEAFHNGQAVLALLMESTAPLPPPNVFHAAIETIA